MATLNLGRIKPVFRGAYAGGTAYVVDDIVTSGNETFICIQASTGNATSNASYWTKLAAKGTDGTDVGTTITTQGDILYRDGSGLQRLAKPASDMYLKNTSAGAVSWSAISSDLVKLAGVDLSSSSAASYNFAQFMDDTVYRGYKIFVMMKADSDADGQSINFRFLNNTTPYTGSNDYRHAGTHAYRRTDNSENAQSVTADGDGRDYGQMHGWGSNSSYWNFFDFTIMGKQSGGHMGWHVQSWGRDASGGSGNYIWTDKYGGVLYNTGNIDGIQFYMSAGDLHNSEFTIWGLKK